MVPLRHWEPVSDPTVKSQLTPEARSHKVFACPSAAQMVCDGKTITFLVTGAALVPWITFASTATWFLLASSRHSAVRPTLLKCNSTQALLVDDELADFAVLVPPKIRALPSIGSYSATSSDMVRTCSVYGN
ncbi:hypothetical protein FA10DRAFT_33655 [Acaromyces ingoldii]|uniref:Uncharacterized protein n=1 Tax=Acaromyces ingoldii TaxID=215250 RepID=A0A316YWG5_9BASI|nr:hypothetical protein FA10DRAFT_33655 [Acaromyces ingoldii]PWN93870.1 hypothetical protein FA10DRAFT_33655 [Acaromyces ingoldii]